MIIQILGDFDYKPTSCGLTDMVVTFKRLSGNEELALRRGDESTLPERRFIATIAGILNPPILEFPDGRKRPLEVGDIPDIPEIASLYFELVVAYSEKTNLGPEEVKKKESPSTLF